MPPLSCRRSRFLRRASGRVPYVAFERLFSLSERPSSFLPLLSRHLDTFFSLSLKTSPVNGFFFFLATLEPAADPPLKPQDRFRELLPLHAAARYEQIADSFPLDRS